MNKAKNIEGSVWAVDPPIEGKKFVDVQVVDQWWNDDAIGFFDLNKKLLKLITEKTVEEAFKNLGYEIQV